MWRYMALCGDMGGIGRYVALCDVMRCSLALSDINLPYAASCGVIWRYVAICCVVWCYVALCIFMCR